MRELPKTMASIARHSAPKRPMPYSSAADKTAYINHFTTAGGVAKSVDTAGIWAGPQIRAAWVFPDGSYYVSDWSGCIVKS